MTKRLVSRSHFARIAGVSPTAVTKACKRQLAPAGVQDRIDVDHPAAVAYLAEHGTAPPPRIDRARRKTAKRAQRSDGAPTAPSRKRQKPQAAPTKRRPKKEQSAEPAAEVPEVLEAALDLTLRQIVARYGTDRNFKDLLEARAKIAAVQQRELDMQSRRGELVRRDFVRNHIVTPIDTCLRRILTDGSKTMARRLYALANAGAPIEEGERVAVEVIGAHIELAKQQAAKALRDA